MKESPDDQCTLVLEHDPDGYAVFKALTSGAIVVEDGEDEMPAVVDLNGNPVDDDGSAMSSFGRTESKTQVHSPAELARFLAEQNDSEPEEPAAPVEENAALSDDGHDAGEQTDLGNVGTGKFNQNLDGDGDVDLHDIQIALGDNRVKAEGDRLSTIAPALNDETVQPTVAPTKIGSLDVLMPTAVTNDGTPVTVTVALPIGMQFNGNAKAGFYIEHCKPNSNAVESGAMKSGQRIVRVNASAVDGLSKQAVSQLMKDSPEGQCTLVLEHDPEGFSTFKAHIMAATVNNHLSPAVQAAIANGAVHKEAADAAAAERAVVDAAAAEVAAAEKASADAAAAAAVVEAEAATAAVAAAAAETAAIAAAAAEAEVAAGVAAAAAAAAEAEATASAAAAVAEAEAAASAAAAATVASGAAASEGCIAVSVKKPLGLTFVEKGGKFEIKKLKPEGNATATGQVFPGMLIVSVNGTSTEGLPTKAEVTALIKETLGPICKLELLPAPADFVDPNAVAEAAAEYDETEAALAALAATAGANVGQMDAGGYMIPVAAAPEPAPSVKKKKKKASIAAGGAPGEGDVGSRVTVQGYDECSTGTLRFVGPHHETGKTRYGVEMDAAVDKGRNGTFKGQEYFKCKKGLGVLVVASKIQLGGGDGGGGGGGGGDGGADTMLESQMLEMDAMLAPTTAAAEPDPYEGMGRLQLVKKCKELGLDYAAVAKDPDALKSMLRRATAKPDLAF
jgi:C-terminal processing protease CtpA/Prc